MRKFSVGQRKSVVEFCTNSAVAWLTVGIVSPFFTSRSFSEFIAFAFWGVAMTLSFLSASLLVAKGLKT